MKKKNCSGRKNAKKSTHKSNGWWGSSTIAADMEAGMHIDLKYLAEQAKAQQSSVRRKAR